MSYRILVVASLVFISFAFLSCSKDGSPSGPEQQSVAQYAGEWTGTTGQNLPVYFRINSQGEIDSLTVRLRMNLGIGTCTATFVKDTTAMVQGNMFTARVKFPGASFNTMVRATFNSSSSASGTSDAYSGSFALVCGSSVTIGTGIPLGAGTWTATKTGQ